jgi:hypothetical protein
VSRHLPKTVERELEYIAERCDPAEDLFIADSNFGMYPQDLEHCNIIARMQDKHSWPQYIHVATGKNEKERVLDASRTIRGAMRLSASVQSTDSIVLRNVKRHNISLENIFTLGKAASETGANTYSELILALPGDSLKAHLQSLKDVLSAGLNTVRPFTLMLLQGTEVASRKSMVEFQMMPKYRVLPRCFGRYPWLDEEEIVAVEIEKVCVENSTLSFGDYLECRRFHLTIEIFFNDGILADIYEILKAFGITAYSFLQEIHGAVDKSELEIVYVEFMQETKHELWNSPYEIKEFMKKPEVLEKYKSGKYGANLLFKYKTLALTERTTSVLDIATEQASKMIRQNGGTKLKKRPWIFDFLGELKCYYYNRIVEFLNTDEVFEETFDFDVFGFSSQSTSLDEVVQSRQKIRFSHDDDQKRIIRLNKELFGEDLIGTSRLLSQVYIKRCFRIAEVMEEVERTREETSLAQML